MVLVVIASYLYLVYTDYVKMLSPVKDDLLGVASWGRAMWRCAGETRARQTWMLWSLSILSTFFLSGGVIGWDFTSSVVDGFRKDALRNQAFLHVFLSWPVLHNLCQSAPWQKGNQPFCSWAHNYPALALALVKKQIDQIFWHQSTQIIEDQCAWHAMTVLIVCVASSR